MSLPFSNLSRLHQIIYLLFGGLTIAFSIQAFAQFDAGALQQNLEKQIPNPSPLALPKPKEKENISPKEPGQNDVVFVVRSFVLEGVNLLPEDRIQKILKPWIGKSVNFEELQKACDAITTLYRQNSYTVQAILPPQKILNGQVLIVVTEAKLSSVIVDTPEGETRFSKERASAYITYANSIGAPLDSDAIERAVQILNETPGVNVTSELEPGEQDGETAVHLQLTEPEWYQGKVELNNYGSRSTGASQGVIAFSALNPTGIGDQINLNSIYSEGLQYLQGSYSFPGANNGLRLGVSASYLNYKNVSNYAMSSGAGYGDAWTTGLSSAYPLVREEGVNINLTANYDFKSYNNRNIYGMTVISSYNINDFTIGISGNLADSLWGVNEGSLAFVYGNLQILSTSAPGYGEFTPATYTKFTFSGKRTQRLDEDGDTSLYIAMNGQLSSVNLNSAEQIYLGGPYSVRAYPIGQAGGSQGGIATLELRQQFPRAITGYIFYDAGLIQQFKNTYAGWQGLTNANNTYSLMGAGLGLKWAWENWNLGAMLAWQIGKNPLYSATGQALNTDGTSTNPLGWFTASYQF